MPMMDTPVLLKEGYIDIMVKHGKKYLKIEKFIALRCCLSRRDGQLVNLLVVMVSFFIINKR
jgi:hypothetical protein